MDTLKTPNERFDFSNMVLNTPISLNSGNHFIKYKIDDIPLYIQAPKCKLKQGIVKASKRMYCDLMFTNDDAVFINWIERLETFSQKKIFENREKWFETVLEENDIEQSFTPTMKIFKAGKFYTLRVSIPTLLGQSVLKIYDEDENLVEIENIKENDTVLTALEIQGIKCSVRSFQIEIELKQMLILKENNIFEKCILNSRNDLAKTRTTNTEPDVEPYVEPEVVKDVDVEDESSNKIEMEVKEPEPELYESSELEINKEMEQSDLVNEVVETHDNTDVNHEDEINDSNETIKEEPEEPEEIQENKEPIEFEINLENLEGDVLNLKKKNDIYYEMYREALKRAKASKDLALNQFLEAKRIKNTYMLEDIDDSDLEDDSINSDE